MGIADHQILCLAPDLAADAQTSDIASVLQGREGAVESLQSGLPYLVIWQRQYLRIVQGRGRWGEIDRARERQAKRLHSGVLLGHFQRHEDAVLVTNPRCSRQIPRYAPHGRRGATGDLCRRSCGFLMSALPHPGDRRRAGCGPPVAHTTRHTPLRHAGPWSRVLSLGPVQRWPGARRVPCFSFRRRYKPPLNMST